MRRSWPLSGHQLSSDIHPFTTHNLWGLCMLPNDTVVRKCKCNFHTLGLSWIKDGQSRPTPFNQILDYFSCPHPDINQKFIITPIFAFSPTTPNQGYFLYHLKISLTYCISPCLTSGMTYCLVGRLETLFAYWVYHLCYFGCMRGGKCQNLHNLDKQHILFESSFQSLKI